ncbi:hypothetical protein ACTXT7_010100 [Hymenolepis weldensis]
MARCQNALSIGATSIELDSINQVTHVVRSVRRWQASHPNSLIRKLGFYTKHFFFRRQSCLVVGVLA